MNILDAKGADLASVRWPELQGFDEIRPPGEDIVKAVLRGIHAYVTKIGRVVLENFRKTGKDRNSLAHNGKFLAALYPSRLGSDTDPAAFENREEHVTQCLEGFNRAATIDINLGDIGVWVDAIADYLCKVTKMAISDKSNLDGLKTRLGVICTSGPNSARC